MCIGIPMRVIEATDGCAVCEGMGMRRDVNTLLVGNQPVGAWLLVFLDSARVVLSEEEAARISDAVKALAMVMRGEGSDPAAIDALFPDLAGREPQLPAHAVKAIED